MSSRVFIRGARLLAIASVVAIGVNSIVWAIADWHLADMRVYQEAALRIRAGEPLYGGDVDALSAYRYAPWFAYAWVPLTYLPQAAINILWSAFLLVGAALSTWAVVRRPSAARVILVLLVGPILFGISAIGNVQAPMIALLILGIPRRWGWLAVGAAASLKVVPLLLALVFVAERRWWQAAAAVVSAVALWLPVAWMSADAVTFDPGLARTLPAAAWLAVGGLAVGTAALLAWRESRHAALAAATAAILALPRLFVYEISLLLVGTLELERRQDEVHRQPGSRRNVRVAPERVSVRHTDPGND